MTKQTHTKVKRKSQKVNRYGLLTFFVFGTHQRTCGAFLYGQNPPNSPKKGYTVRTPYGQHLNFAQKTRFCADRIGD